MTLGSFLYQLGRIQGDHNKVTKVMESETEWIVDQISREPGSLPPVTEKFMQYLSISPRRSRWDSFWNSILNPIENIFKK